MLHSENQAAYDLATSRLFGFLDELEQTLIESGPFLLGGKITIADVLVFTALVRFDPVYPLFRIGGKRLSDFPALTAFVRRVFEIPGIAETVLFDHILAHYFDSDWSIPPRRGIVPNLTQLTWYKAPGGKEDRGSRVAIFPLWQHLTTTLKYPLVVNRIGTRQCACSIPPDRVTRVSDLLEAGLDVRVTKIEVTRVRLCSSDVVRLDHLRMRGSHGATRSDAGDALVGCLTAGTRR